MISATGLNNGDFNEITVGTNTIIDETGVQVYHPYNILLPTESKIVELPMNILQEQIVALSTTVPSIQIAADGKSLQTIDKKILAIPYYTWCNRGSNQMQVWIPISIKDIIMNN